MTTNEAIATENPTDRTDHNLWPAVSADDAIGLRAWLTAVGFDEGILVVSDSDPTMVIHSEMIWPEGGRVMVSSADKRDQTFVMAAGSASVYVVCDHPDQVYAKAMALGAELIRDMADEDYGSRGFGVRDPAGNRWSFGTYAG